MSIISSVTRYVPKALGYGKRIIKAAPDAIFGTGAEVAGAAMRNTRGSGLVRAKAGFRALENMQTSGSFFKRATANLGLIKSMPAKYARAAKIAGKGTLGQLGARVKGLFKGLGKNMPFIAAATTLLFELPNIWKATKEQGIGQGVKEIGKTGARLAGGAALAAVGSAICPGIGTIVGWFVGDWLTSKVVGKSYSEKVAEAQEAQEAALEQANIQMQQPGQIQMPVQQPQINQNPGQLSDPIPFQGNINNNVPNYNNPFMTNNFQMDSFSNPYANDIMMQQINFDTYM